MSLNSISDASPLAQASMLHAQTQDAGVRWYEHEPDERQVIQWLQDEIEEFQQADTDADREDELGDILMFVVRLANLHGLDCDRALVHSMEKFRQRIDVMSRLAQDVHGHRDFRLLRASQVSALWYDAKRQPTTEQGTAL